MANVIIRRYNTFFDHATNVQFNPILDKVSGNYIGAAVVSDDLIGHFTRNTAYEVVTDEELKTIESGIPPDSTQKPPTEETKLKVAPAPLEKQSPTKD